MNKESNELQSRREFFKKAAKGALPILGAVILASSPIISKAVESEPMGCNYGCTSMCKDYCMNGCDNGCQNTCNSTCTGSCSGTCYNTCHGTCSGGCARMAYA